MPQTCSGDRSSHLETKVNGWCDVVSWRLSFLWHHAVWHYLVETYLFGWYGENMKSHMVRLLPECIDRHVAINENYGLYNSTRYRNAHALCQIIDHFFHHVAFPPLPDHPRPQTEARLVTKDHLTPFLFLEFSPYTRADDYADVQLWEVAPERK